jgi:hypothetical protein
MIAETICYAASAAGLGIAAITAYRKRFLAAARTTAYALLPAGLAMTGVVQWVAHTAFSPTAWAGFGVLAVGVVLFMITRAVDRHRGATRKERRAAARAAREAVAPAAGAPSLGASSRPAAQAAAATQPKGARPAGAQKQEDFSDIEAILKKHGI